MWLLTHGHLATVTVGAASVLVDESAETLRRRLWAAVQQAIAVPGGPPLARIFKLREGTYLHTPAAEAAKPALDAGLSNLRLAGDWTVPGMVANLDSAARSGHLAADALR